MAISTSIDDPRVLERLKQTWSGQWSIWRARSSRDDGNQRTGDFVASRLEQSAGVEPTIICSDPEALNRALTKQREMAERGDKSLL